MKPYFCVFKGLVGFMTNYTDQPDEFLWLTIYIAIIIHRSIAK